MTKHPIPAPEGATAASAMTPTEARERLVTLAGMVALEAPRIRNEYAQEAKIPWSIIEEIRTTMGLAGINYRRAREAFEQKKREALARRTSP